MRQSAPPKPMMLMAGIAALLTLALSDSAAAADPSVRVRTASPNTILLSSPDTGMTVGKQGNQSILLQKTPSGTVGRVGNEKVFLHQDNNGNSFGRIGNRQMFCHNDKATGVVLCKE